MKKENEYTFDDGQRFDLMVTKVRRDLEHVRPDGHLTKGDKVEGGHIAGAKVKWQGHMVVNFKTFIKVVLVSMCICAVVCEHVWWGVCMCRGV